MYVLTVTETLEDWEDSVNIGRVLLHVLPLSINTYCSEGCCLHRTLYFLLMWKLEYCTETTQTLAVTTGAYKSRPLIITAVVLSCSILQLSVRRTSVSSLCNPKPNVSPLFLLWTLKTFIAYVSLVCIWIFEGFQVYIWVSRYYRYIWILYLHPTLMRPIIAACLPHCDILWNVSVQHHLVFYFFLLTSEDGVTCRSY